MIETLIKSLMITGGIILFCGVLVLVGFTANDILKLLRIESSNTRFIISVIAMIFTLIALMITSNDINKSNQESIQLYHNSSVETQKVNEQVIEYLKSQNEINKQLMDAVQHQQKLIEDLQEQVKK